MNMTKSKPSAAANLPADIQKILNNFNPAAWLKANAPKVDKAGLDLASYEKVRLLFMIVTPDMARAWLKNNFNNRPLKDDTVVAYARDMNNGDWVTTHQGIAFNDLDELIDGQHKLNAVVMSGVSCMMLVSFGWPSKIEGKELTPMDCVDRGAPRSVGDQLMIQHGIKNASITAQLCAGLSHLCYGQRTRRLSVGQTLDIFRAFEPSVLWAIKHRSKENGLKTAGVLSAFAFSRAAIGDIVEPMFYRLNSGMELDLHPVIKLLHAFLTSEESKLFSLTMNRGLAELTLQGIYLESQGQKIKTIEELLAADGKPITAGADHFRSLQKDRVEKIAALFRLPKPVAQTSKSAVSQVSKPADAPPVKARPTLEKILAVAQSHFGLDKVLLLGRGTDDDIAFPRHAVFDVALDLGHPAENISVLFRKPVSSIECAPAWLKSYLAKRAKKQTKLDAFKAKFA